MSLALESPYSSASTPTSPPASPPGHTHRARRRRIAELVRGQRLWLHAFDELYLARGGPSIWTLTTAERHQLWSEAAGRTPAEMMDVIDAMADE